jgi:hypothetical protein
MTMVHCEGVRRQVGAYIDGELGGVEMLRVAQHLGVCRDCADEVEGLSAVGDLLRRITDGDGRGADLDGLASGVIARVRAESAQSWRSTFARAVDDCRWLIVGTGSVAGTMASAILVTVILFFGAAAERDDSLAAVFNNMGKSAGTLLVVGSPDAGRRGPVVVQVSHGGSTRFVSIVEAGLVGPSHDELIGMLADAVMRQGRLVELSAMNQSDREYTEALLDEMSRRRSTELVRVGSGPVEVREVRMLVSTDVTAKGL